MSAKRPKLKLLLDEGVPRSVGLKFTECGHDVAYVTDNDMIVRGSPDPLVASAAVLNDRILVAIDGDMRAIAKNIGVGENRYKNLSLIKFSCPEPKAKERLNEFISLIEHEWTQCVNKEGRRIFIEISKGFFKSNR